MIYSMYLFDAKKYAVLSVDRAPIDCDNDVLQAIPQTFIIW